MVAGHPGGSKSGLEPEPMQLLQGSGSVAHPQPHAVVAENPESEMLISGKQFSKTVKKLWIYRYFHSQAIAANGLPPIATHRDLRRPVLTVHCTHVPCTKCIVQRIRPPLTTRRTNSIRKKCAIRHPTRPRTILLKSIPVPIADTCRVPHIINRAKCTAPHRRRLPVARERHLRLHRPLVHLLQRQRVPDTAGIRCHRTSIIMDLRTTRPATVLVEANATIEACNLLTWVRKSMIIAHCSKQRWCPSRVCVCALYMVLHLNSIRSEII